MPPADTSDLETAAGHPRDFLGNRFVYVVISPRARGLCLGVNMNPDKFCNFNCPYCEVNRNTPPRDTCLDLEVMAGEVVKTLEFLHSGGLETQPQYRRLPRSLLQLRHITLSGHGEPTLCPVFTEVIEHLTHIRAVGPAPPCKFVLITNSSGLHLPQVQQGLRHFTREDEIWAKLDAGTQSCMNKVNAPADITLAKVLANILATARKRAVVIQSLFCSINGQPPTEREIDDYAQRLKKLRSDGAAISLVQIYSATRPIQNPQCTHLPLATLSGIASHVRSVTRLNVEVF